MGSNLENNGREGSPAAQSGDYWGNLSTQLQQGNVQPESSRSPWMPQVVPDVPQYPTPQVVRDVTPQSRIPAETAQLQPQQNPLAMLAEAEQRFSTNGMQLETKDLYQKAIKAADQLFQSDDRAVVLALSQVLATGKKNDGTPITSEERVEAHRIINAELKAASLGVQMRFVYSQQLMSSRQFATAEQVLKESVKQADLLPKDLIAQESKQLQTDMKDMSLARDQQGKLMEYWKDIPGTRSLQQPGFDYLPALTRLQLASFYVSAGVRDDKGMVTGVIKPELAIATLNEAKAVLQKSTSSDHTAIAESDPLYNALLKKSTDLLPENLKKLKSNANSLWSDPLIDLGVGGVVVGLAGAALAARFPFLAELGLMTAEGTATLGGRALAGGLMLGTATAGRHYAKEALTGESETWFQSTVHGAAGLGEIGLLLGAKGKASQLLYRGADSESALLRIAQEKGTDGLLNMGNLKDIYRAQRWTMPAELAAADSAQVIVKDGKLVASIDLGLDSAKSASLVKASIGGEPVKGVFARSAKFFSELPSATVENAKNVFNFKPVDLMTASPQQLAWRSRWSGYVPAVAGVEGYRAITSLDPKYDTETGERLSLAKSFEKNVLTLDPLAEALFMGPFFRAGVMPSNFYAEGAGVARRALAGTRGVFRSAGPLATSENVFARGAYSAIPAYASSYSNLQNLQNKGAADEYKDLLQQQGH